MYKESSLEITGYNNQPVSNSFFRQEEDTGRLTVIFPGYNPPLLRPSLYYISNVVLSLNSDLLQVEHEYYKTAFSGEEELLRRLKDDVTAACESVFARRDYERITLVGKSLGTRAMAFLLDDSRFRKADCVWLTPLLTDEFLRTQIIKYRPRSLFIIGTADPYYTKEYLDEVTAATGGDSLVVEGANHSLNIAGDIEASLAALSGVVMKAAEFIS